MDQFFPCFPLSILLTTVLPLVVHCASKATEGKVPAPRGLRRPVHLYMTQLTQESKRVVCVGEDSRHMSYTLQSRLLPDYVRPAFASPWCLGTQPRIGRRARRKRSKKIGRRARRKRSKKTARRRLSTNEGTCTALNEGKEFR